MPQVPEVSEIVTRDPLTDFESVTLWGAAQVALSGLTRTVIAPPRSTVLSATSSEKVMAMGEFTRTPVPEGSAMTTTGRASKRALITIPVPLPVIVAMVSAAVASRNETSPSPENFSHCTKAYSA